MSSATGKKTIISGAQLDFTRDRIMTLAEKLAPKLMEYGALLFGEEDPAWDNRSCICLRMQPAGLEPATGFRINFLVGGPGGNWDKRVKYHEYSTEKAERLDEHLDEGHLTSFESRDPERQRYQGAIVVPLNGVEWILAGSGVPEPGDETYVMLLAARFAPGNLGIENRLKEIHRRTGNETYQPLRAALMGLW
jgi:hypothetical protein